MTQDAGIAGGHVLLSRGDQRGKRKRRAKENPKQKGENACKTDTARQMPFVREGIQGQQ